MEKIKPKERYRLIDPFLILHPHNGEIPRQTKKNE